MPTRLRGGGEHLAPVAVLGELADVDDERAARRRASATATWIARLSPGVHRTGNAGAATTAPGHARAIRGAMMRAPDSPSVAAPKSRSSARISPSLGMSCRRPSGFGACDWRRERDLNPRGGLTPPTRLAGEHFRPLSHPSEWDRSIRNGVRSRPVGSERRRRPPLRRCCRRDGRRRGRPPPRAGPGPGSSRCAGAGGRCAGRGGRAGSSGRRTGAGSGPGTSGGPARRRRGPSRARAARASSAKSAGSRSAAQSAATESSRTRSAQARSARSYAHARADRSASGRITRCSSRTLASRTTSPSVRSSGSAPASPLAGGEVQVRVLGAQAQLVLAFERGLEPEHLVVGDRELALVLVDELVRRGAVVERGLLTARQLGAPVRELVRAVGARQPRDEGVVVDAQRRRVHDRVAERCEHPRARAVRSRDLLGAPVRVPARRVGGAPVGPQQPHARRARRRAPCPSSAADRADRRVVDEHHHVREPGQRRREARRRRRRTRPARSAATSTTGSRRPPRTNASSSAAREASAWCGTRPHRPAAVHAAHRVDELADQARARWRRRPDDPGPSDRATPTARRPRRDRRPPRW